MKKLISTLLVLLFSQEFLSDSYEDEVRKRLGLLKNKPMVTMASAVSYTHLTLPTNREV